MRDEDIYESQETLCDSYLPNSAEIMRSFFDFISAFIGLVVLLPVMVVISVGIVFSSGWPVFFLDERIGKYGKKYRVIKFRTMRKNASLHGPAITTNEDGRVTSFGRYLRKYKLDELPQLVNVIRGEMSLVGPRPERPEIVRLYSNKQRRILDYRPGITSPASLRYRNEAELLTSTNWKSEYQDNVLPLKIAIDMDYLETRTLMKDIVIIIRSVYCSFFQS